VGGKDENAMGKTASGTFEVKMTPQAAIDGIGDPTVGRLAIDKRFQGDLDGTSKGEMLGTRTLVDGSAGYVAIERVTGTIHGRSGSFSLLHRGIMNRGNLEHSVTVIPDSGTGELASIAGTMTIKIDGGEHSYELEYSLSAAVGAAP
jgi:Protein of unknown function (DUF3224)